MAPCLWTARPPGVGPPARSRGARAPDSRPSGRGGVSGDLETAVKGKDGRRGGRAGQTPATSGADGVISRALNGTGSLFGLRTMVTRSRRLAPTLTEFLHEFSEWHCLAVKLEMDGSEALRLPWEPSWKSPPPLEREPG